jgi:magnesium-transporting ATPase (P-type)
MGTVVHSGSGTGVVVATGSRTKFGKIAAGLDTHQFDTQFQVGLRKFSMLLVYVATALTASILVINLVLHRPILDSLLFSLAIAVGIFPPSSLQAWQPGLAGCQRKGLIKRRGASRILATSTVSTLLGCWSS